MWTTKTTMDSPLARVCNPKNLTISEIVSYFVFVPNKNSLFEYYASTLSTLLWTTWIEYFSYSFDKNDKRKYRMMMMMIFFQHKIRIINRSIHKWRKKSKCRCWSSHFNQATNQKKRQEKKRKDAKLLHFGHYPFENNIENIESDQRWRMSTTLRIHLMINDAF